MAIVELESFVLILNRWIALLIFVVGVLGNVLNVFIFSSGRLLKQSISWYFFVNSLNNLGMFFTGLSTRILDEGFQVPLFGGGSSIFCRIRTFVVYTLFSISSWLVVGATLDRFYSTNSSALKRQRFCSISTAKKSIVSTFVACSLIHVHLLIFFDYVSQLTPFDEWKLSCVSTSSTYSLFFAFFILVFYSLLPPMLISLVGLFTLKNLRRSRRQVNPGAGPRHRRPVDQLLKTLFIQILMLIICTSPHSAYWIYMGLSSIGGATKTNASLSTSFDFFSTSITAVRSMFHIFFRRDFSRICSQCKRRLTRRE